MSNAALTELEWEAIEALLENGWPGDFTPGQGDAYRTFLGRYPAAQLLEALQTLVHRGGAFRPSVAEIVEAINRDAGRPTFDEAYELLFGRRGAVLVSDQARALERADASHPLVGAFLRVHGLDRLRQLPLDCPDWGQVERRKLEEAWNRHVEVCDQRLATGRALESMGLREQIGPRRLDPLGILGPALTPVGELEAGESA